MASKAPSTRFSNTTAASSPIALGLGKTYEALAVIKYFELRNERVLVLCPKKLRENWTVYTANSSLNPFLSRPLPLRRSFAHRPQSRSRQFRRHRSSRRSIGATTTSSSSTNRTTSATTRPAERDEDGNLIRKSRYQRLMDDIIKAGVRTKVLLLSATPVNNDLKDLRNQIYFLTEGSDDAFAKRLVSAVSRIRSTAAQKVFTLWARKQQFGAQEPETCWKSSAPPSSSCSTS